MSSGRSNAERLLPLGYFAAALALVVVALPTVLRPPQQPPTQSAELSPDAPPDDNQQAIISSLSRAGSQTAGSTEVLGETVGPVEVPTSVVRKPSRGRCFGDPPRQTESVYSPPCAEAFRGDNGGATYRGVSSTEVRVGFWHALGMPVERGPVNPNPPQGGAESAELRTFRVLQQYFNEQYELYGRRLQLVAHEDSASPEDDRAQAAKADAEHKVFASTHVSAAFCDELARRRLVCFNGNPFRRSTAEKAAPHLWSYQMNVDQNEDMTAEYVCKKLVGRPADHAGGVDEGRPRRIGIITESVYVTEFRKSADLEAKIRATCGEPIHAKADVSVGGGDNSSLVAMATAISQMRQSGVTTIVLIASISPFLAAMQSADAAGYFPEWVQVNSYGMDFNDSARLMPAAQMEHTFGMSGWEVPRPFSETGCFRAYKSVDPAGEPDETSCSIIWVSIEHIVNGIQLAGPDLTPETFAAGLFAYGRRVPREPWAISGGYAVGDRSFVDTYGEVWWDRYATDPAGDQIGTYRWTHGGRRYGLGEIPSDTDQLFREGVASRSN